MPDHIEVGRKDREAVDLGRRELEREFEAKVAREVVRAVERVGEGVLEQGRETTTGGVEGDRLIVEEKQAAELETDLDRALLDVGLGMRGAAQSQAGEGDEGDEVAVAVGHRWDSRRLQGKPRGPEGTSTAGARS